jgi:hypothetical protein
VLADSSLSRQAQAGRAHLCAWNAALGGGVQIDDVYVDPFKVN